MTEFELKFQVPRERAASVEAALQRGAVERTRLRARYFDTADAALARHCLVLRLRQEGRHLVQAAKGPGGRGFDRLEHEMPLAQHADTPDISLHADHPVGKLLRRALDEASSPLQPVFETDIVRHSRVLKAAGTSVEIALDQGRIRAGDASLPVLELEFELKEGNPATLVELAQRWCEQHGLWLDPLSKSAAAWRLADGVQQAPAVQAEAVQPQDSAQALLAAILDAGLAQVLGNARELAAGNGGDEHVHQLRVGLRRVRTALRELGAWAPPGAIAQDLGDALHEVFGVLGEHRDRSTLLPKLRAELEAVGAPLAGWDAPLPDVAAVVRSTDFQLPLLRLVALVQELHAGASGGLKGARKDARARLHKLHRKTLRDGRKFRALAAPQRHQVRKRLKRLRYLSELVRPLFDGKAVDRYVASLKQLQDALGAYQDAAAGRQMFAQHATEDGRAWFAAGWLTAREEELAADCERACRKTSGDVQPFWT
ncbi:CHAD domain-containing protein [Ramlibacter ginsenosidimutans]|uniref:CHAD domain-containing protein n=1 Tax=Ramlibacter ginsenosidimutans TaxID=502333 RepID=A0A934WMC3_9BURK|nr:CHAD domain-containing protein [Ramlibacter ginsenosidimutans]